MAFTTLVFAQLFNCFNARSDRTSAFRKLFTNRLLWGAIALSALLQVAVVELPFLNDAFGTTPLGLSDWLICSARERRPLGGRAEEACRTSWSIGLVCLSRVGKYVSCVVVGVDCTEWPRPSASTDRTSTSRSVTVNALDTTPAVWTGSSGKWRGRVSAGLGATSPLPRWRPSRLGTCSQAARPVLREARGRTGATLLALDASTAAACSGSSSAIPSPNWCTTALLRDRRTPTRTAGVDAAHDRRRYRRLAGVTRRPRLRRRHRDAGRRHGGGRRRG